MATLTLEMSGGLLEYLEERALKLTTRTGKRVTVAQAAVAEISAARARRETLARDANKERRIKAGDTSVKRKRYQPRQPSEKVAEPSTPEKVKVWAAKAPEPHGGIFE